MTFVGIPIGILQLVLLAKWVLGWKDTAKKTIERAKWTKEHVRGFVETAGEMPRIRIAASLAVTVLVPLAQTLLLGLWYLVGEYIYLAANHDRAEATVQLVEQYRFDVLRPPLLAQALPPNPVADISLLIGLATLAVAYSRAAAGKTLDGLAMVVASPGWLLVGLAYIGLMLGAAVAALLAGIMLLGLLFAGTSFDFGSFLPLLPIPAVGAVGYLYVWACEAGVHGAELVVRAWSASAKSGARALDEFGPPSRPW